MYDPVLTVSVIIPTYNRPRQLRQCLEGLAAQNCPREAFEVIVVDDGGTESLTEIHHVFRSRLRVDPYFYLCLLSHSIKRPLRQGFPVLGAVLVSQLANAAGYLWEKIVCEPPSSNAIPAPPNS